MMRLAHEIRSFPARAVLLRQRSRVSLPRHWSVAIRLLLLGWCVAGGQICWAQKASNWRVYKLTDGLPESGCIAVSFSPQRKVLVRHLNLQYVTELDGYTQRVMAAPETGKSRVYQSPGGQLWTAVPGGLEEFREGGRVMHPIPVLGSGQELGARVIDPVPLQPVKQGIVLFLQPDGLMEYNAEYPGKSQVLKAAEDTEIGRFWGMTSPREREGSVWVSGARGLALVPGPLRLLKPDVPWREFLVPPELQVQNLQAPQDGGQKASATDALFVTTVANCATNDSKVVVCFDGADWQVLKAGEYRVRQAWRGPERAIWGIGINAVFRWEQNQQGPKEVTDISARQYFDVAVEPGGAFWLATSEGLFRYAPLLWSCPPTMRDLSPVICIASDSEGRLLFCSGGKLSVFNGQTVEEIALPVFAHLQPRALFPIRGDTFVLAMEDPEAPGTDSLFTFSEGGGRLAKIPGAPERVRTLGRLTDGTLCVQNLGSANLGSTSGLEVFDGRNFRSFPSPLPFPGAGTNLNIMFTAQNGDIWLGGDQGVAVLHERTWRFFGSLEKVGPEDASFFAELPDGKIWSAGGDEIWEFDGRNWSNLRKGLDTVNGLLRTRDGSVWAASNNGLHRWFRGVWVDHGIEEGLPAASVRGLQETAEGLWVATARGLSLFHPEADIDPPRTWVTKLAGENQTGREAGSVTLSFRGQDKWKYTAAERLLYSYRLDEREWSPCQEQGQVSFNDLGSGKHYFQVRAMDRNSNTDPKPAQLEFSIVLPWYREVRLVLIALAGAAAALFFGGVALNKHLQLLKSYAEVERKVAQRTRELEVANRELLQSQKMTALGTLAAGIAHDFNNILSIIKGSAQIIEDNLDNQEKIQTRANRIKTVVEQGAGIVKAMLGFSRESGPLPELCSVNTVIEDTLRLLGDRFLREVQVKFEPGADLPQIATARDFVQQILLNFIFNAAESMATRKEIVLASQRVEQLPPELILAPAPASGYVIVSVKDYGCGIPPENLARIFEPFFTTKALSARRGTGLGLSMVYELARKLGAGLVVRSTVGEGSTFVLLLPVVELPVNKAVSETDSKAP